MHSQSESSLNQHDIAFIAQDSRQVRSQSISMQCSSSIFSEVSSMSGISRISRRSSNQKSLSLYNDPSISDMEEWPNQQIHIFGNMKKKARVSTRFAKPTIQQNNIQQQELECSSSNEMEEPELGKCSKKRLCQKMKLITINETRKSPKVQQTPGKNKEYVSKLRSSSNKHKMQRLMENDSSAQDLRAIVQQLGGKKQSREYYSIKSGKK